MLHADEMISDISSTSSHVHSAAEDSLSEQTVTRKKRQRHYSTQYHRRLYPFPPIYKNDIRRLIGNMFANVLNSNDFRLFKRFFLRFCAPHCAYRHIFHVAPVVQKLFPTALACSLLDQLVLHGAYVFATIPDLICRMQDCKIIQAQDRTSTVSITMHLTGMRVFEIGQEQMIPRMQEVVGSGRSCEHLNEAAVIPSLPYLDESTLHRMRVSVDSLAFSCESTFIIKLDEHQAVTAVDFHWCTLDLALPRGVAPPRPPCAETRVPDIFPFSSHPPMPAELAALEGNLEIFDDPY